MSRVVHVRNVVSESMNEELVAFASQFGTVAAVCHLAKFNQALIEMDSVNSATALVMYARSNPVFIKDREVHFSFSKSQQINQPTKTGPAPPNRILLVTILNPVYNITVDVLFAIMSPYGPVQRIVVFSKTGIQALVEFDTAQSATAAKTALEGKDIYAGSCTLKIEYSRADKLNVSANTEKTRDYVNPGIPNGTIQPNVFFGPSGQVMTSPALQLMRDQYPGMGGPMVGYPLNVDPNAVAAQAQAAAMDFCRSLGADTRTVLMVYNIDDKAFTPDRLFNLFCLYGNVLKIKCLANKKGVAMIQMSDGGMAEAARSNLSMATVFGQQIQITFSKHPYILDSRASSAEDGGDESGNRLCKDFSTSPLNRFKSTSIARHVYRPTHSLYFNNMPNDYTEANVIGIFRTLSAPLPAVVKFFPRRMGDMMKEDRKEGIIEFEDTGAATDALIFANNSKVANVYLRLSFSKPLLSGQPQFQPNSTSSSSTTPASPQSQTMAPATTRPPGTGQ